jgi:hypothetical protein
MPRLDNTSLLKNKSPCRAANRNKRGRKDEHKEVLRAFQTSAERTCESEFWSRNGTLAQIVIKASVEDDSSPFLSSSAIDEASATTLLKTAKRVIKEANQTNSVDCLCVGAHCLRAISTSSLVRKVKSQEAVIRVLYHAVVTAEAALGETNGRASVDQELAFAYGLVAYDSLGNIMQQSGYSVDSKRGRVQFAPPDNSWDENQRSIFCVPVAAPDTSGMHGDITPDLVCTIAISTTLAVSRTLLATLKRRVSASGEPPSQPHFAVLTAVGTSRSTLCDTISHLLCDVLPAWIDYSESEKSCDDAEFAKEVVLNFKRAHLLLWEAADHEMDPIRALKLRELSLASLLCCVKGQYRPSKNVHQLLVSKGHYEVACTMAKKAVSALGNNSPGEVIDAFPAGALVGFHSAVGAALDAFAVKISPVVPGVYVDYCAQRALDGIVERRALPCRVCSSTCLFKRSLHTFGHADCTNSHDAAVMSLFFLAVGVRDHLKGLEQGRSPILDDATRIVLNFKAVALDGATGSHETNYRAFHLLWSLKLHVAVFDATNAFSEGSSEHFQTLGLAADLLVACIGPLASRTLHGAKAKAAPHLWNAVLESFSRGIAAHEAIFVRPNASGAVLSASSLRSEESSIVLVETLLRSTEDGTCDLRGFIEKAAKVRKKKWCCLFLLACSLLTESSRRRSSCPLWLGVDKSRQTLFWSHSCSLSNCTLHSVFRQKKMNRSERPLRDGCG